MFDDDFGCLVHYEAFAGTKLDALSFDGTVSHQGSSSLKLVVPTPGDPSGSYSGGAFVTSEPRSLVPYNALSFWATASRSVTLDVAGLGNDNTGVSTYEARRFGIPITTGWSRVLIPIPLPGRLDAEKGLFLVAEGPQGGAGLTLWIDDVQFVHDATITNPRPILTTKTLEVAAGMTVSLDGMTRTIFSIDGVDQTVTHMPGYFSFMSSDPSVASVIGDAIHALGAGSAIITATLGAIDAAGSITVNAMAPPASAAPTPSDPPNEVISLFSNAYTNHLVDTWSAAWDRADVADVQIAGNDAKLFTNLVYAGIEFTSRLIDASPMTHLHMDVWAPTGTVFKVKLVDFGANGVYGGGDDSQSEVAFDAASTPPFRAGTWVELEILLENFTSLVSRAHLAQLLISGDARTVYVDNVYFIGTPPTHEIVAGAGPYGSIDPSGVVVVQRGLDQTFRITPDAHHHVGEVVVDGGFLGAPTSYTFTNVTSDHTIDAFFAIDTHVLSVAVVGSGTVVRSPDLPRYDYGTTVLLTPMPAPGWEFAGWRGDVSGSEPTVSLFVDGDKTVTATFGVVVAFEFKPHHLNLKSNGKWVTGYIELPAPYLASQIDVASIRLNDVVAVTAEYPARIEDHDTRLKVKFLRSEVKPTLVPGDHVPVTISGVIGGACFSGTDHIQVKAPKIHHPFAGEMIAAGTVTEVTWETGGEAPARSVTLLSSLDDGVTWNIEVEGLANTGVCTWGVPGIATDQVRLAVILIYGVDETGVIAESEFAVSDPFSIATPTAVDGRNATFAMRITNPMAGPVTVSFSLAGGAPATLTAYDVSGRQVASREVGSSGLGWHTARLGDLPAGVYVVRLSQAGRSLFSRVAVIR